MIFSPDNKVNEGKYKIQEDILNRYTKIAVRIYDNEFSKMYTCEKQIAFQMQET